MLLRLTCKACLLPVAVSIWCSAHIMPSFHLSKYTDLVCLRGSRSSLNLAMFVSTEQ